MRARHDLFVRTACEETTQFVQQTTDMNATTNIRRYSSSGRAFRPSPHPSGSQRTRGDSWNSPLPRQSKPFRSPGS